MPLPTDAFNHSSLRIAPQSPRDAQAWAIVYRRRIRERPSERWLRLLAITGALLVHLAFLFGMLLGAAYEPLELREHDENPLLVKLLDRIELPPPPPPPPLLGLPPKQFGPRHQGMLGSAKTSPRRASISQSSTAAALPPVPTNRPSTKVLPTEAPSLAPLAQAALPPASPIAPSMTPPAPPTFQPEPVRPPRPEAKQPQPPPTSLALPELPEASSPGMAPPSVAIAAALPPANATPNVVMPTRVELSAAPSTPELQPVPLPARPSPTVSLPASSAIQMTAPNVPREQLRIQVPSIHVVKAPSKAVLPAPSTPPSIEPSRPPAVVAQTLPAPAPPALAPKIESSVPRPQLSSPLPSIPATPAPPAASTMTTPATSTASQPNSQAVSTAPNATPRGSDTAPLGQPNGVNAAGGQASGVVPGAPQIYGKDGSIKLGSSAAGSEAGDRGHSPSDQNAGFAPGPSGTYMQLRPHGNTEIMAHDTPNFGYKRTRFEDAWTPRGESSVDTALRHAVEKTTLKHTFRLPRGVRVKCVVMPLFPMALLGCGNGDPPPAPVADKVYERMHLAPVKPLAPALPTSAGSAPSSINPAPINPAPVKLDNAVACAAARISGGPPPPGCTGSNLPPKRPASSSSSWVPASDQFH